MMNKGKWNLTGISLACLAFAISSNSVGAEDVDMPGKAKFTTCAACHGTKAEGRPGFPSLNWMEEDAIVEALTDYKQMITRGDMSGIMFGQAAMLSENDIVDIAKYIVTLNEDKQ